MNDCLYLLKVEDTDAVLLGQDLDHDLATLHLIHTISGRSIMSVYPVTASPFTSVLTH